MWCAFSAPIECVGLHNFCWWNLSSSFLWSACSSHVYITVRVHLFVGLWKWSEHWPVCGCIGSYVFEMNCGIMYIYIQITATKTYGPINSAHIRSVCRSISFAFKLTHPNRYVAMRLKWYHTAEIFDKVYASTKKKHHQCGTWHLVTFLEQTHNVRSKISTIKTTIMVMLNNRTYRIMTFSHREILHTKQRAYIRSRRYHANTTNVKMHTANTWNNFYQQKLCHFFATTKNDSEKDEKLTKIFRLQH